MSASPDRREDVLDEGTVRFTIESRILRELGERLVKQPEVALLELVKNSYDADARQCEVLHEPPERIVVADDGHGMTLDEFKQGWMRIGTSSKESSPNSRDFDRIITGEKGIGRFAVRFLGKALHLESVAVDRERKTRTRLIADFNWPAFDRNEDLGKVEVPFRLVRVPDDVPIGTRLEISKLRAAATEIDLYAVRTASIGVVTPYHALLKDVRLGTSLVAGTSTQERADPGFALKIQPSHDDSADGDVARAVLDGFVLRAVVRLRGDRLRVRVHRRGQATPTTDINDRYVNRIGPVRSEERRVGKECRL